MIHVLHHANGPRVYVLNLRVHHGLVGLALTAAGALKRNRAVALGGLTLIMHDRQDWRVWLRIEKWNVIEVSAERESA